MGCGVLSVVREKKKVYPVIRCPDGVLRSYADWEDNVKPRWREMMRRENSELGE